MATSTIRPRQWLSKVTSSTTSHTAGNLWASAIVAHSALTAPLALASPCCLDKTEGTGTPAQSGGITRKRAMHSFSTRDNDTADKHAVGAQRINRQCNTRIHYHCRATMQMARADHDGQAA